MEDKNYTYRSRTHHIHVMLSDEENRKFEAQVKKSGLSKREFVTRSVLGKQIIVFDGWHDLIHQLTKIGNNYDQTLANVYMGTATAEDLKNVNDDVKEIIATVRSTMRGQIENADIHSPKQ